MYFDMAEQENACARLATSVADREFHQRREASWMNLAASAAFSERVDAFLRTRPARAKPLHACRDCQDAMAIDTVEVGHRKVVYRYKCCGCGGVDQKVLVSSVLRS
jgi:hypothetical protein